MGNPMKPTCLLEEFSDAWAGKRPSGQACNHEPIMIELKPVPQDARLRIQAHLQWLKDTGILTEC
jgi:hypothetical protein